MIASEKRNGQQFFKPIQDKRSLIELSYYSNCLAAHFALDSVVICAAQKQLQIHEQSNPNTVSLSDLLLFYVEKPSTQSINYNLSFYFYNRNLKLVKMIYFKRALNTVIYSDMSSCSINLAKN